MRGDHEQAYGTGIAYVENSERVEVNKREKSIQMQNHTAHEKGKQQKGNTRTDNRKKKRD